MPTTKKESLYFGLTMCFGMVFVMTMYNLLLNKLLTELSFAQLLFELLCGFSVALVLDFFVVGPLAKKIAFKLPINKSKKAHVILAISTCMVFGMAACMSLYGLGTAYWSNHLGGESLFSSYLNTFGKNIALALPLQLLVIGPLVRYLFIRFMQKKPASAIGNASS